MIQQDPLLRFVGFFSVFFFLLQSVVGHAVGRHCGCVGAGGEGGSPRRVCFNLLGRLPTSASLQAVDFACIRSEEPLALTLRWEILRQAEGYVTVFFLWGVNL